MYYNMYIHPDLPKPLLWAPEKSDVLKRTRGASFDEVLTGDILDIQRNKARHHQKVMIVFYQGDIWVIAYIEEDRYLFLKTMYRSRKDRKRYIKEDE
jgi:hypothetical protein